MTVLEADTNRGEARGEVFGGVVDFVKTRAAPGECTGNLVQKDGARKTSV